VDREPASLLGLVAKGEGRQNLTAATTVPQLGRDNWLLKRASKPLGIYTGMYLPIYNAVWWIFPGSTSTWGASNNFLVRAIDFGINVLIFVPAPGTPAQYEFSADALDTQAAEVSGTGGSLLGQWSLEALQASIPDCPTTPYPYQTT
jgi:hypothetical protein